MTRRFNRFLPPVVATALLRRVVVEPHREAVLCEMAELYRHRVERIGSRAARRWYRRQTAAFVFQLIWHGRAQSRAPVHLHLPITPTAGATIMSEFFNDLKRAYHRLMRAPIFSMVSVLTLAIGIGVFVSVFALVEGVLLEPMPYRAPNQLAWVWRDYTWSNFPRGWLGGSDIVGLREQTNVFEQVVAVRTGTVNLSQGESDTPRRVPSMFASPELFDILGVSPILGRGFAVGEDDPDADAVVVLGYDLWQSTFSADSEILGQTIDLSGTSATVIGVAPENFRFKKHGSLSDPVGAELYSNLRIDLQSTSPGSGAYAGLVRIRPDVQSQELDQALVNAAQTSDVFFDNRGLRLWTIGLQPDLIVSVRPALIALVVSAATLLLVLTANLATLFLSRAAMRARELGICAALGASRARLFSSVLTESLFVGFVGGSLGVGLAFVGSDLMLALAPESLPRLHEVGIDFSVFAVALGITVAITFLTGMVPAIQSIGKPIGSSLQEGGRSSDTVRGARLRSTLVVGQIALSLVLLVVAGLVAQAFTTLIKQDPGFDPGETLTFSVSLTFARYGDAPAVAAQHDRIRSAFSALPGVTAVGAASSLPLTQRTNQNDVKFPTAPGNTGDDNEDNPQADSFRITRGYLAAAGFRVLAGRDFTQNDDERGAAIIDDVLAARFFPNTSPIGHQVLTFGDTLDIVGVVDHARLYNVFEDDRGQVYVPVGYRPATTLSYVLRGPTDPTILSSSARRILSSLDPTAPISQIQSLSDIVDDSLGEQRLSLTLLGTFAVSALALAVLGIYGVVTNNVVRRRREIGLRIALGATGSRVLRLVLGQGLRLTIVGGVLGLVGAVVMSRFLKSMMFGIQVASPIVYGGMAILLICVATAASYFPARRATAIDPIGSLRDS